MTNYFCKVSNICKRLNFSLPFPGSLNMTAKFSLHSKTKLLINLDSLLQLEFLGLAYMEVSHCVLLKTRLP